MPRQSPSTNRWLAILLSFSTAVGTAPFASSAAPLAETISPDWPAKAVSRGEATSILPQKTVVVAVIDTGLDLAHPAFRDRLWTNPGETGRDSQGRDKATNGADDDSNGFVDDLHGWNFAENNGNLSDHHGHGTHVAGIIAAQKSGPFDHEGLAPNVRVMVLKYTDPKFLAADPVQATIRSIDYAIRNGAQIINYSSGGWARSPDEEAAIRRAGDANVLFVAAAGNEGSNTDILGYYPAGYGLPNILAVTAMSESRMVLPKSNYGSQSVHIVAPGKDILSTMPGGRYGLMTGTSQATAFASGIAALILGSQSRALNPTALAYRVRATGTFDERFVGKAETPASVNAFRALVMRDQSQDAFGRNPAQTQEFDETLFLSKTKPGSFDPSARGPNSRAQ